MEIALISNKGELYTHSGRLDVDVSNLKQYDWYIEAMKNIDKLHWISTHNTFRAEQSEQVFTAVKFLQGEYTGKSYGLLLINIKELDLYNIYKDSLQQYNELFIVDAGGHVITHSNRDLIGQQLEPRFAKLLDNDSFPAIVNQDSELIIYNKIPGIDWYIIQTIPNSIISNDIMQLRFKILIVSLLVLVLSAVFAVLISRRLTQPILALSKRVKAYMTGGRATKNELEFLVSGYDHIITRLEMTVNQLLDNQDEKRKAELKVLQMQVSPHFLYNTLSSIKCLVWVNKVHLIEPTINALVNLLEHTIDRYDEFITLEEELTSIKHFVFIHEVRRDQSFDVRIEIDEELKHLLVPKLILQPIVENAIFHGIESLSENGYVTVQCYINEGDIVVEIHDNGIGIDQTRLDSLNSNNLGKLNYNGIGIHNVSERLKLYYGEASRVEIKSVLGQGTRVILKIPCSTIGEDENV